MKNIYISSNGDDGDRAFSMESNGEVVTGNNKPDTIELTINESVLLNQSLLNYSTKYPAIVDNIYDLPESEKYMVKFVGNNKMKKDMERLIFEII